MFSRVNGGVGLVLRFIGAGVSMSLGIGRLGAVFPAGFGCFGNGGCLTRTAWLPCAQYVSNEMSTCGFGAAAPFGPGVEACVSNCVSCVSLNRLRGRTVAASYELSDGCTSWESRAIYLAVTH